MLTQEKMVANGNLLFRWRGQIPVILIPWLAYAALQGEPAEVMLGDLGGNIVEFLGLALLFGGIALRAYSVGHAPRGTSGRNKQGQVAEVLNTTGIYSQCRNPLYLANCMMYLGLAVFAQSLMLTLVMALALALYYERIIMAEEAFLEQKFGDAYRDWAAGVPAFFPKFRDWTAPRFSFSIRSTLRREYPGWMAAVILLVAVELTHDRIEGEALSDEMMTWVVAGIAILGCVALDLMKRKTSLLVVEGR